VEGGDAEVKAIMDIQERRLCKQGIRSRNGRVNAEINAVKPPERRGAGWVCQTSSVSGMKAHIGVANIKRTRERPQPQ